MGEDACKFFVFVMLLTTSTLLSKKQLEATWSGAQYVMISTLPSASIWRSRVKEYSKLRKYSQSESCGRETSRENIQSTKQGYKQLPHLPRKQRHQPLVRPQKCRHPAPVVITISDSESSQESPSPGPLRYHPTSPPQQQKQQRQERPQQQE